ncbi:hypothetical protein GC175_04665 [bacterium]|nr:hypothetical protein [bacterium]
MAAPLQIQLLGSFSVLLDDQPVYAFRSAKARALLAFLAAQPEREHPRSALATLFWGDLPDDAARTNLRIELSNLKKLLGNHPALLITRNTARLDTLLATVDAVGFHESVDAFLSLPVEMQRTQLYRLSAALGVYAGDFLDGFHLVDAPEFEDWQRATREHLHEAMMQALETLQIRYAEQARWEDLAATARRQLALEPWREEAHCRLIQALAAQGQLQAALDQYEHCRTLLMSELGIEPSPETQALAARLRHEPAPVQVTRHNLPLQRKSFVGRTEEATRLHTLVQRERLVTLLGIGGVGKSSLALAVAQDLLHRFEYGVWFVPLANIAAGETTPQQIALAIAAAIGFQITNLQTPLDEVVAHLADKPMLLILDNWDHLTAAADALLSPLFEHTPVHILATSRARLMLENEAPVRLDGLAGVDAFALFVDRARRASSDFGVGDEIEDPAGIFRICEQVHGLPLGIELAASWVEHFSVEEIRQSLARIAVEPSQMQSYAPRHHTLNSVFEYSWRLLSPAQQRILARVSVFRGGFDRKAAAAVAESTLSDLSLLIGYSLVQRVTAGRYDLHPLIQEFSAEKLTATQQATLQRRHSAHYLNALIATPQDDLARLLVDFENVRSAWQGAIRAGNMAALGPSIAVFAEFIASFGLMTEGESLFREAIARFHEDGDNEVVAQLFFQQWRFTRALRGLREASVLVEHVLALSDNPILRIQAHIDLANANAESGVWEQANLHFDSAEALLKQSSDLLAYIRVVESRIHINAMHFRGDFAAGIARLQEMIALLDTVENASADVEELRIRLPLSLALIATRYGDYALAIRCGLENLSRVMNLSHRHKRVWVLLDLALTEQFAGLFEDAAAHNLEALAIAEEIGAMDDVGLLSANLCLTLRQTGRLSEGLAYGVKGAELLRRLRALRQEGQARNRVGHTLLSMHRWAEAAEAYAEALAVWEPLQHPNRIEAVAGRAIAAFHLNRSDEALALVEETLSFVARAGLQGAVEPVFLLLNCEDVLRGVGQVDRAQQALQLADDWIRRIAARISDESIRRVFLARPDNRELWQRLAQTTAADKRVP